MSLTNIKLNSQAQRGFTIVELLIVVVVIAILAAITIVSYNGITNNAKKSSAQAAATTIAKKAELYQAEKSRYPVSFSELNVAGDSGKAWYIPAQGNTVWADGTTTISSAPNNPDAVVVVKCASGQSAGVAQSAIDSTNITGLVVKWWDYTANSSQTKLVKVGDTATTTACQS